jgi:hypothetical protein
MFKEIEALIVENEKNKSEYYIASFIFQDNYLTMTSIKNFGAVRHSLVCSKNKQFFFYLNQNENKIFFVHIDFHQ